MLPFAARSPLATRPVRLFLFGSAAAIPRGRHELAVEYYQVDGWVELSVDIQPVRPR